MTRDQLQVLLALQPPRTYAEVSFTYVGYYGEDDGWIGNLSELPYTFGASGWLRLHPLDSGYDDMLTRYRLLKR